MFCFLENELSELKEKEARVEERKPTDGKEARDFTVEAWTLNWKQAQEAAEEKANH